MRRFLLRYSVCFVVAFLLVFTGLIIEGKTLIWSVDGLEIHYPWFSYEGKWLRDIAKTFFDSGQIVVPMWDASIGLGSDVLLSVGFNPFNLISAFFPQKYADIGMVFVAVLQMYLAGLSFSLYARNRRQPNYAILAGSIVYVFCGWMVFAALRQHLFLTPMVFFPLMLMGVDWVFDRKSPLLFIVSCSLMFIAYFYFAYMSVIALFFYCLYSYIRKVDNKSTSSFLFWTFKLASLIVVSALISGFAFLPYAASVLGQGRLRLEHFVPILYQPYYYGLFITAFLVDGGIGADAYIGFGAIGFIATVMLFARKGNRALKVMLVASTFAAIVPFFGYAANGFSYVTNRWCWIYSFCIAFVVVRMSPRLFNSTARDRGIVAISLVILGFVLTVLPNTRSASAYSTCFLGALFVIWLYLKAEKNASWRLDKGRLAQYAIVLFSIASVSLPAFFLVSDAGQFFADEQIKIGDAQKAHSAAPAATVNRIEDESIWRYDCYGIARLRNNSMAKRQNSFDYYTPFYNEDLDAFLTGLEVATLRYCHSLTNLDRRSLVEAVLDAKYFVIKDNNKEYLPYGYSEEPIVDHKASGSEYSVFESNIALPLGYVSSKRISEEEYSSLDAVEKQQALCQVVVSDSGSADLVSVSELDFEDQEVNYRIANVSQGISIDGDIYTVEKAGATIELALEAPKEAETYVRLEFGGCKGIAPTLPDNPRLEDYVDYLRNCYYWNEPYDFNIRVSASNGFSDTLNFMTSSHHLYGGKNAALVNLGMNDDAIRKVTIAFEEPGVYSLKDLRVISQSVSSLDEWLSGLNQSSVNVVETDSGYEAAAEVRHSGVLCVSIPWSTGWKAYVDGAEAETVKTNTAFLGVSVTEGEHCIRFEYRTPLLLEGACCSAIGVVLCVIIVLVHAQRKRSA